MDSFSSTPKFKSPGEKQSLLPRTSQPLSPRSSSQSLERTQHANQFLRESLLITDPEVLALAFPTLEPVLNALINPRRPVLQVDYHEGGRDFKVLECEAADMANLLALGEFLLAHKQSAALYVLACSVLRIRNDPDHPHMVPLLHACGKAIEQAAQPPASLVGKLRGVAELCVDRHGYLRELLSLFEPRPASEQDLSAQSARNAVLREFGASPEQCQQVQADAALRDALDRLLSGATPRFAVVENGMGLRTFTIRGDATHDELARIAERLLDLKLPGAARLFVVLALSSDSENPDKQIRRYGACSRALLQAAPGAMPERAWAQLGPSLCKLAANGALPADVLSRFEEAARLHGYPLIQAQCRIGSGLARLSKETDPKKSQALALGLIHEIVQAHELDKANQDVITLMVKLCDLGRSRKAAWADSAAQVLQALLKAS